MVKVGGFSGGGNSEGKYVWKKLTTQGGDFIDYVVSDSETDYPDGGTQGGYWYEKSGGGGEVPIEYTFTGSSQLRYIEEEVNGKKMLGYELKLLSSGTLKIKSDATKHRDVYVIGGGGGGGGAYSTANGGGGGAGGYLSKSIGHTINKNTDYPIIIGAGGAGGVVNTTWGNSNAGGAGGQSSAFGITANGGGAGLQQH